MCSPGLPAQGETFAELAAGSGAGTAAAWRYVTQVVALLAARAPKLRQALRHARKAGHARLVTDGTLIPVDRVAAERPFCCGKHRKHGMNLQVMANPGGDIVGVPGPLPGAVHDLITARIWGIIGELAAWGLVLLGDKGDIGKDDIRTPRRGRNQARLAETRHPGSCPAHELADRAEALLPPVARRAPVQSHLRPSHPRNRRTTTVQGSMTVPTRDNLRIAVIATGGAGEPELADPVRAVREAGARPELASIKPGPIQAVRHDRRPAQAFAVDKMLDQADPEDYEALLLPGGAVNAGRLPPNRPCSPSSSR